jgi:hypothetical protein
MAGTGRVFWLLSVLICDNTCWIRAGAVFAGIKITSGRRREVSECGWESEVLVVKDSPNGRRRVDRDTQLKRDEEIARLRQAKVPFREIARRLGCSLGSVQLGLARWQERQARFAAMDADDDDDDWEASPWSRLSPEELRRLERAEGEKVLASDPTNALWLWRLEMMDAADRGFYG